MAPGAWYAALGLLLAAGAVAPAGAVPAASMASAAPAPARRALEPEPLPATDPPPSQAWPITFDRTGLGHSPVGSVLYRAWARSPALIALALRQQILRTGSSGDWRATAERAGFSCERDAPRCHWSGEVRARLHPSARLAHYFGPQERLRIDLRLAPTAGGEWSLDVTKTPS